MNAVVNLKEKWRSSIGIFFRPDQESVGGYIVLPESYLYLHYPIIATLDKNGDIMIDTKADRLTRIVMDEYISITKEAALMIFGENNSDYETDYAVNYLEGIMQ